MVWHNDVRSFTYEKTTDIDIVPIHFQHSELFKKNFRVNDDTIAKDIERALRTLTGGLEEQREAAPIATFLSTVFLGF